MTRFQASRWLCIAAATAAIGWTTPAAHQAAGDVTVTVTYTGKGTVDAAHQILLFLFANQNIDANSEPLAMQAVQKNGGTATFKGVTVSPVYLVAVYNEKGDYTGREGPPPPGTPIAHYAAKQALPPEPIVPGPKAIVKMKFDDSRRWK